MILGGWKSHETLSFSQKKAPRDDVRNLVCDGLRGLLPNHPDGTVVAALGLCLQSWLMQLHNVTYSYSVICNAITADRREIALSR